MHLKRKKIEKYIALLRQTGIEGEFTSRMAVMALKDLPTKIDRRYKYRQQIPMTSVMGNILRSSNEVVKVSDKSYDSYSGSSNGALWMWKEEYERCKNEL